ncbi:MAG: glycosyltransferase 87 family protein [Desulfurivibrionaceae bacterium]
MRVANFSVSVKDKFIWLFTAAVSLFGLVFVYRRGLDINWDLLNYHYSTGYSLLQGSYLHDLAPAGLQSFLNPVPNILVFLALSKLAFPASAWAIALVQLLSLPILVLIARQLGRDLGLAKAGAAEFLALVLCLLAPLWWSELGTSFTDSTTTPLVLAGLYLGLRGVVRGEKGGKILLLSGILFGLATGLKLTHAPLALGFFVALLGVSRDYRRAQTIRLLLSFSTGILLGFAVTAWWNIYLFHNWGSPFFPLYNAWLKSPYADLINNNFCGPHWQFNSGADFARYIWAATRGTAQTSEVPFADARLLVFLALTIAVLAVRKNRTSSGRVSLFFLLFLGSGFFLWAVVFAYQRYLIPMEVLFGFGIWLLLSRLTGNPNRVALLLAGCLLATAALMKVPNWGHLPVGVKAPANHFGLQLPPAASATPARYLVAGRPISYILPFLHPDSRFYGLGFSTQVDELIRRTVAQNEPLPLRILAGQADAATIWNILAPFGFAPPKNRLSCAHFRTNIDKYVLCEIQGESREESFAPVEIDFQDSKQLLPPSVLGVNGLSAQEPWGRWSDGDEVEIRFANCLPEGPLKIDLRGHAFGPNVGKPVKVTIGQSQTSLVFGEDDRDLTATLENNQQCQTSLSIRVPEKVSPSALGINPDSRTLGLGLVRLGIGPAR